MKRDKMRVFAWLLVTVGLLFICLGIVAAMGQSARYDNEMQAWERIRALNRIIIEMHGDPPGPMPARPATPLDLFFFGCELGMLPLAFGVLLLAIRRPIWLEKRRSLGFRVTAARAALNSLVAEAPLPKATAATPPPWEKEAP
jgi:hypothetical protein